MNVTLKDVARAANVSTATASLALNGKYVNEETRQKVVNIARDLNYVPITFGKNLITGKSKTIGLYMLLSREVPELSDDNSYFYQIMRGVVKSAEIFGYSFHFGTGYWEDINENEFILHNVSRRIVDGLIIFPYYDFPYYFLEKLEHDKTPYVICNPCKTIPKARIILSDNREGASKAVQYLIDLGHRNIGAIHGPSIHIDARIRAEAFIETLAENNIAVNPDCIVHSNFTIQGGYESFKKIIENSSIVPDAIFCANDHMAAGAMKAAWELGYKIPSDISIMGFDYSDIAVCTYPELTTINAHTFEFGEKAANRLFEIMFENDAGLEPVIIKPDLVIGHSCMPK